MTILAPLLPAELAERWGIQSSTLIADTRTSVIHRVLRRDGTTAITKQLKPSALHELPGMDFLGWRQGHGAARLLDRCGMACLLEDAGTVMLKDYRLAHGEEVSNGVIVTLLGQLHETSASPPPASLLPLREHFRALFERAGTSTGTALSDMLRICASMAETLLASQVDIRPLHGDLHHENIISGETRGWLAIDPQGLIGDPAYDVANIFGNPDGAFPEIIGRARITRLMSLFSPLIGCSEEKILRYAIAHAGLSICWSIEDGDGVSDNANAMERFAFAEAALPMLDEIALRR
jgi:streptomycin 6-kinase